MSKTMRKIVEIDESKCDGCGLCIPSCAEGALQIVDGKAKLVKDIYCDGLGSCLGECPWDAVSIVEREAEPFNEEAVEERLGKLNEKVSLAVSCPGCASTGERFTAEKEAAESEKAAHKSSSAALEPELVHWPVQLHLVSPEARFLKDCDLLIAADCVPFAYADFHAGLLAGRSLLIGCPKLDDVDKYLAKLTAIFKNNELKSITLARMEVPCCSGLVSLARSALEAAGKNIPFQEVIVGVDGSIKQV